MELPAAVVRRAVADDVASCHRVAVDTFPSSCPPGISGEDIARFIAEKLSEDAWRGYLANPRHTVFLAEVGGEVVGYAMVIAPAETRTGPDTPHRDNALELSKMYVTAPHYGGAVAGALMGAVLRLATARGHSAVWLGVNVRNERANRFYARWGFDPVGDRRFVVGGSVQRDVVRQKVLNG